MNTKLKEILLRHRPLSDKEWRSIIGNCVEMIRPYRDKVTFPRFDALGCIPDSMGFYQPLSAYRSESGGDFLATDQGLTGFVDTGERVSAFGAHRSINAWGLSRAGDWVTLKIDVEGAGIPHVSRLTECVRHVLIKVATLEAMLQHAQVKPFVVFRALHTAVTQWEANRRAALEDMSKLENEFKSLEGFLMHNILREKKK